MSGVQIPLGALRLLVTSLGTFALLVGLSRRVKRLGKSGHFSQLPCGSIHVMDNIVHYMNTFKTH